MNNIASGIRRACNTKARWSAVVMLALSGVGCAHHDKPAAAAAVSVPAPKAPPPSDTAEHPADAPKPVMDQQALDRLRQMSTTLRSANSFSYRSRSMTETPAPTGQNLTFFTEASVAVLRPDMLRATVSGDLPRFELFYDGSRVSALDPKENLYAVTDAPGTIDETLRFLMDQSGIRIPASDVLFSDPYTVMAKDVSSAWVVGPSEVGGFACDHLAFMAPGINWEIWVDADKTALPRRLAVTYKDVTNFPRFLLEFSDWNLKPKLSRQSFAFVKPPKARQIEFAPRAEVAAPQPARRP